MFECPSSSLFDKQTTSLISWVPSYADRLFSNNFLWEIGDWDSVLTCPCDLYIIFVLYVQKKYVGEIPVGSGFRFSWNTWRIILATKVEEWREESGLFFIPEESMAHICCKEGQLLRPFRDVAIPLERARLGDITELCLTTASCKKER